MALRDDIRVLVRTTTTLTDVELEMYIAAAKARMRTLGVRRELLEEPLHPSVKYAIAMFCKANYGYDNSEADRFNRNYERELIGLLNSSFNEVADEVE